MTFFWIVVIIIVVWWLASRSKKTESFSVSTESKKDEPQEKITEEMIFKSEAYFENKLEEEIDFPDAIQGYPIYVYKNLMRPWYKKLSGENRYDDEMIQQLRSDWMDYMWSIGKSATSRYLYMETSEETDPEKSKSHYEKANIAHKKIVAIEDGFAALLGKDAINELKHIRDLHKENLRKFDKYGNLAPEGFEYDFMDELQKEKIHNDTI
jgi:hypothetical protein